MHLARDDVADAAPDPTYSRLVLLFDAWKSSFDGAGKRIRKPAGAPAVSAKRKSRTPDAATTAAVRKAMSA